MTKFMLAAGAAALALAAPAFALKGGGGGGGGGGNPHGQGGGGGGNPHGGGGGGGGNPHDGGGGGGNPHGEGVGGFAREHGGGGEHGGGRAMMAHGGHDRGHGGGHAMMSHGGGQRYARAMAGHGFRQQRRAERMAFRDVRRAKGTGGLRGGHAERFVEQRSGANPVRDNSRSLALAGIGAGAGFGGARFADYAGQRRVIDACPPGLAAKNNGCMPPGLLKKQWGYGAPLRQDYADNYLPGLFRSWYPDSDRYYYRYGDGYAYQVNRGDNLVNGLFPLGPSDYYAPGQNYPAAYDIYNVPQPYQRYYPDQGDYAYRFGDGAIYQVDRSSGVVQSIVALLTSGLGGGLGGGLGALGGVLGGLGGSGGGLDSGLASGLGGIGGALGGLGGLGVGQQFPAGYDVYNVPYAYRDRYYDSPEANYRYANGDIYQIDPKTQLIQQIISSVV